MVARIGKLVPDIIENDRNILPIRDRRCGRNKSRAAGVLLAPGSFRYGPDRFDFCAGLFSRNSSTYRGGRSGP